MRHSFSALPRPARWAIRAGLVLLAAAAVFLLIFYLVVRSRAGALQKGSAFSFDYQVTSTAAEPSAAYNTLKALDGLTGTLSGQSSGSDLYLAWYAAGQDQPFTDIYVQDGTVLLNIRQIYRTFLSGLSAKYPLIGSLIPDWTLGDYITQDQLAVLMGSQPPYPRWRTIRSAPFPPRICGRSTPRTVSRDTSILPPGSPWETRKLSSASPSRASGPSFSGARSWWICPPRAFIWN